MNKFTTLPRRGYQRTAVVAGSSGREWRENRDARRAVLVEQLATAKKLFGEVIGHPDFPKELAHPGFETSLQLDSLHEKFAKLTANKS